MLKHQSNRSFLPRFCLFLVIAFLAWLGYHWTPMMRDDILYHFQINKEEVTTDLISTWEQAWASAWNLRHVHNGRLCNGLFVITAFLGSKMLLDIVNALVFGTFVCMMSLLYMRKVTCWSLCVALGLVLLMLPFPDRVLFWAAGAYNYLWGGTCLVCFLYFLRKQETHEQTSTWSGVLCLLFAFFCGCMHEALGIPLLCGLILYRMWCYCVEKVLPTRQAIWSMLAIAVGSAVVLSAPALFLRSAAQHSSLTNGALENTIFSTGLFVYNCWVGLGLFLFAFLKKFKWDKKHIFWLAYLLPNLAVTCRFGIQGSWGGSQFYPMIVMALFILDKWGEYFLSAKSWLRYTTYILLFACCVSFYCNRYTLKQQHAEALRQSQTQPIYVIDGYSESHLPDWAFFGALPYSFHLTKTATQIKKLYHLGNLSPGTPNFATIFNIYVKDKTVYDEWTHSPGDTCQVFRKDSTYFIRAPKGFMTSIYHLNQYAITHDGNRVPLKVYWFVQAQLAPFMNLIGKNTGVIGEDFHDGFHYIILPDTQSQYAQIHFTLVNLKTAETLPQTLPLK